MEKIKIFSLVFGILFFNSCENTEVPKTIKVKTNTVETVEARFQEAKPMAMSIEGMVCALGCAGVIEKNLNETTGIKEAKVDFETKKATLIFDAKVISPAEVTQVVLNTGEAYRVKNFKILD